jgi:hypothetical protein
MTDKDYIPENRTIELGPEACLDKVLSTNCSGDTFIPVDRVRDELQMVIRAMGVEVNISPETGNARPDVRWEAMDGYNAPQT